MTETACRLGLVGYGRWGKLILRDLAALGCQVWVVAPNNASQKNASHYNAFGVVPDVASLPDDLQGYVVATPTVTHFDVIENLAARGRPIFCEKPLCNELSDAESIVRRWGDLVFVMDKWCYHPAIEQLRRWVQTEKLGRLQAIRTRRLQWGSPHTDVDAPWILLPHDLSIVRHLLGELPAIDGASGQMDGDRIVSASVHLDGSVDCLLEVSTFSSVGHRRIEIYAEDGAAVVDGSDYSCVLWNHRDALSSFAAAPQKCAVDTTLPLAAELAAFVNYVHLDGAPPLTSAAQGLETVACISRAIEMIRCRCLL
jgi:predicted dehydrogenase